MVFLVPFDGSPATRAALSRAVEHGRALDREVVAVSFVPTGTEHVERRKWIEPTEDFAVESAAEELKRKIEETTDDTEIVYDESTANAPKNGIASDVRRVASEVDASVLFVGVEGEADGDELDTRFGTVTADADYDVHLVRTA